MPGHGASRSRPALLAAVLSMAALGAGCIVEDDVLPAAVGTEAPAYAAVALDGDSVRLRSMRGDVLLLNVWATWCAPCRREVPELVALQDRHGPDGLRVVGVSVDSRGAHGDIVAFADEFGMDYLLLWDPQEQVQTVFRAHGVPSSVLIDRDGIIRWRQVGPFLRDDPRLQEALTAALAGKS